MLIVISTQRPCLSEYFMYVYITHYSRVNASRQFLKYLSIKGYDVYVVRDVKYKGTDFIPHIYTDAETERYFMAVDSYTGGRNRRDAVQYPVLFRILFCCGLNGYLTCCSVSPFFYRYPSNPSCLE